MVVAEESGAECQLEEEGGARLVEVDATGEVAQVADGRAAAAQDPRAQVVDPVEQLVDECDDLGGAGGRCAVGVVGVECSGARGVGAGRGVEDATPRARAGRPRGGAGRAERRGRRPGLHR
uniref:Uncharacterized protein n=1 Tax=Janibacter limosus TaxID=53458 RepID=A0AC61U5S2_9MICO|nr:hypothetical protein [Janibacter limosus]